MSNYQWTPRVSTDEMIGRLILALLVVGAFILLGLWLRSGSLLDWFATCAVMSLIAFFGGVLRGTPLDMKGSDSPTERPRFAPLLEALGEHPILRALTSNLALRIGTAVLFGIVIASVEQLVSLLIFGWTHLPTILTGLLSLAIVLFPLYSLLGLIRARRQYQASEWAQKVRAGIEQAFNLRTVEMSPRRAAVTGAAFRTLGSVVVRALAVLVLPVIFSNWFAVAFVAVVALTLIVGGDTLLHVVRTATGSTGSAPNPDQQEGEQE